MHEADSIEYAEMLGDRLPSHRQLLAQCGRGATAVREQQVEHPPPRRVTDRRPDIVVDLRCW